ncbi:hypothetical protein RCL_jg28401.t1 [Rhizophagus clarus]|uniref:Uncharacterized protein n=1 Tax=Rhizophagus clarus TaxID=94130 RepID=A0A8H3M0M7_9GLOM|nr:hypothetical protein RCL_jg28401.t1 [Rhizophagus clarus]
MKVEEMIHTINPATANNFPNSTIPANEEYDYRYYILAITNIKDTFDFGEREQIEPRTFLRWMNFVIGSLGDKFYELRSQKCEHGRNSDSWILRKYDTTSTFMIKIYVLRLNQDVDVVKTTFKVKRPISCSLTHIGVINICDLLVRDCDQNLFPQNQVQLCNAISGNKSSNPL